MQDETASVLELRKSESLFLERVRVLAGRSVLSLVIRVTGPRAPDLAFGCWLVDRAAYLIVFRGMTVGVYRWGSPEYLLLGCRAAVRQRVLFHPDQHATEPGCALRWTQRVFPTLWCGAQKRRGQLDFSNRASTSFPANERWAGLLLHACRGLLVTRSVRHCLVCVTA